MQTRANIWRRLVAAIVVAVGVGVAWGLAGGWIMALASTFFVDNEITEQLSVALDGTPVISVMSNDAGNYNTLNRRTLDGKPWPNDYEFWLHGTSLRQFELSPGVIQFPISWGGYGERLAGGTDGKKPPTVWYAVSADPDAKRLYFAGFDPYSKLPVGYLGTAGFRVTTPPSDEQFFNASNSPGRTAERVATTQYLERYGIVRYHELSTFDRPPQWLLFVLHGGELWEVNLRERTSRVLLKAPEALSLSMLSTLESIVTAGTPAVEKDAGEASPSIPIPAEDSAAAPRQIPARLVAMQYDLFRAAPTITGTLKAAAGEAEPPKYRSVVAIRMPKQVLLYDTVSGREWTLQLPEQIRPDTSFSFYWLSPDKFLIDRGAGHWDNGSVHELLWVAADGKVEREERVQLLGWRPGSEQQEIWPLVALMPEPLGWIGAIFAAAPFERLQNYKSDTYAAAVQHVVAVAWPMIVIVLAVAVGAAAIAVHWQRKYVRPHTGIWAAFVFLFSVPGLIAYWLEHRSVKLDGCQECGHVVPRDRDACASCSTPFPAPAHLETEIFA
jgi:hypothetical protein